MAKKRVATLALSIALLLAVTVGGTLAYLTDTDSDVNVMTLGNVQIEQIEQERDAEGKLQDFTQHKPVYPAVYEGSSIPWADATDWVVANDEAWKVVQDNENVVDKFITVKNTGASPAYVRTIIAFEVGKDSVNDAYMHLICNGASNTNNAVDFVWTDVVFTEGDTDYAIGVFTYRDALKPGDTTIPSVKQIYLDKTATNEVCEAYGEDFRILAVSQAVQSEGFGSAAAALTAGFGEINEANVKEWFGDLYVMDYTIPAAVVENGVVTVEAGQKAVLTGEQEAITVAGEGTLYLRNVTIEATTGSAVTMAAGSTAKIVVEGDVKLTAAEDAINVPANTTLDLSGKGGNLTAIGGGGTDSANGGSGIGGEGEIYIHDLKDLTAKGYGKAGFGIGGATKTITIENTNIEQVQGGYVQPLCESDPKYGKSEPEGGAAIGSMTSGAVITLNNVTIENAQGGSKSAGIGARYWTGVTINISNCTIKNVEGGNASAGIGGSRIGKNPPAERAVTINIADSNSTAVGGQFGAGIGSGYDTDCQLNQPLCTINITGNSVINATGGMYAAGVGTGYHYAGLAGEIADTVTINAVSGDTVYKDSYTQAQNIGFGVVDPAREALNNTSSITYNGTVIGIPAV